MHKFQQKVSTFDSLTCILKAQVNISHYLVLYESNFKWSKIEKFGT